MKAIRNSILVLGAALLGGCLALSDGTATRGYSDAATRLIPAEGAHRLMSPAAHNFRRASVDAGDPVRRGVSAERFELRHGDCDGTDCTSPRARAEIQLDRKVHPSAVGQDIWYGYSFFNATVPSFAKDNSLRLVFGQWTMGGTSKPIFRFIQLGKNEANFTGCDPKVCNTRDRRNGDLVVQLEDVAKSQSWGKRQNNGYVCRLFDLEKMRGRWVDMMINTNFSAGNDGYLRIWVDQRLVCNYKGPLVAPTSLATGKTPSHRRGIYSSWTKRWAKAEGGRPRPSLIVYYDEFRTGRRMSDVDIKQLEAAAVPPID